MISDDPDEDADNLDDENLLDAFLHPGRDRNAPTPKSGGDSTSDIRDWPQSHGRDGGNDLDPETLLLLKASCADWRSSMGVIVRTWLLARAQARPEA